MTPTGEKIVNDQPLATDPSVEIPEQREDSEQTRESESRRAGLLLVAVGVVLMALAAAEATAAEDRAPGPSTSPANEMRLESTG